MQPSQHKAAQLRPGISTFVHELGGYLADDVFNPWQEVNELYEDIQGPAGRRDRLMAHLNCEPSLILMGEAPGYQGCATSGIPFTSERLLIEGAIPRIEPTGRLTSRPRPWSEPSASILWRTLYELGVAEMTVMWNAFPWHPHAPGNPATNRTLTRKEVAIGADWARRFVALFPNAKLVAVGKTSERLIQSLGLNMAAAVRHPAYGGAPHFKRGITELLSLSGAR